MCKATMFAAVALVVISVTGQVHASANCGGVASQPLPVRTTPVAPLYSGMMGRPMALAAPRAILAESRDESLALDVVLMRLRLEACAGAAKDEFAGYVPKTEFDNTPYRFNMDKDKKFTAAEFDAWMKSRGVRVVGARPTGAAANAANATAEKAAETVKVSE